MLAILFRRSDRPKGHTVAECILAFAILAPVAVLVNKIATQTQRSLRTSELADQARGSLTNAREEIGSWDYDDVSAANIQSRLSTENRDPSYTSEAWLAVVEEVQEPLPAKRVSLSVLWTSPYSNSPNELGPITFWVRKP